MNKAELIEFVNNNRVFSLATCVNNIPYVRNMFLIEATNTEIIFNVKTYKPIYKQLTQNSNVELCFYNKDEGTQVRISGNANEVQNSSLIDKIFIEHPDLKNQTAKYGKNVIALFVIKNWNSSVWKSTDKELKLEIME